MSTLSIAPVAPVLTRLFADAQRVDAEVMQRVRARLQSQGGPTNDRLLADLLEDAYIPVGPDVGRFLYQLVRLKRPRLVVEFGTSLGISAIHIAAALRDNGIGRLVTTELSTTKAKRACQHLREAGLRDLVDLKQGDAFQTLANDAEPIDMLLLDGWKELYLPLLKQLEPRLQPGAVIVADDLKLLPDLLAPYVAYVRDSSNSYLSVELPMDDGVELSLRV
jgi:predicted O-methyltransferase YrrM